MNTHLWTIVCTFGDDPSICLGEEAILTDQTDGQTDGHITILRNELNKPQIYWQKCKRFTKKFTCLQCVHTAQLVHIKVKSSNDNDFYSFFL